VASSPYINRFLQPDTLIPGVDSPQKWNRFSYVYNSPIRYNDPTGHVVACNPNDGDICEHDLVPSSPNSPPKNPSGSGGHCHNDPDCVYGDGGLPNSHEDNGLINDIFETIIHDDFQALEDNNCFVHNLGTINWNDPICVDAASFLLQDIATLSSSASASWTATLTALGCAGAYFSAGTTCAIGYALGYADHVMFFNPLESVASGASFFLTIRSDILTHDLFYFNSWTDWAVGVDTRTSAATFAYGTLVTEPFVDAGIDIYASGYNHGYFCGIDPACIGSAILNVFH